MWTIGHKSQFGTHNANMIYDENGNSVLQVFGIASNCMLEELTERDADGLAIARQVVNDHNTIAALREAGKKMAKQLKDLRDFQQEAEARGQSSITVETEYIFNTEDAVALEAWEAANK